jgi:prepilin peptidase CpaA
LLSYEWFALAASTPWLFFLCLGDWRKRRLPNILTLGGLAVALAFRLGWGGAFFMDGILGALLCGLFLLIPMLVRAAGAGDVKMLAACGAVCGLGGSLHFLLATSLSGLVLVIVMLCLRAADGARLKHYARILFDWRYDRSSGGKTIPSRESEKARIPFGIAIAAGLWTVLAVTCAETFR